MYILITFTSLNHNILKSPVNIRYNVYRPVIYFIILQ